MATTTTAPRRTDSYTQKERVTERSTRLYEDGYRAALVEDTEYCMMITPGGDAYTLDPIAETCNCAYFPHHGFCKHILGLRPLLAAQLRAKTARRELRQQAGSAPTQGVPDAQPAPDFPLVPARQAQPTRRQPSREEIRQHIGQDF